MGHLTVEQRYTISRMLSNGYSQSAIAATIDKDKSVVSREIKRNADARSGAYRCGLAQRKATERHRQKPKSIRFTHGVKADVDALLKEDYSPEQVVGTLKAQGKSYVSHERIYQYIWQDKKQKGDLHTHLRHQGRKYRKRGCSRDKRGIIKDRISIEKRPEIVEKRERFGDLEVDLIIGKNHKQALLTINDRASGMLKMRKVASKQAHVVGQAIVKELQEWAPYIKTITADNGKEFAAHKHVAQQLSIDYYFARPYHSWERGSNENLNGLVRQYFKKSSDFTQITDQQVKEVENKLNQRPRKRFDYKNPTFVMDQLLFKQEVAFMT
jgi:transposase, IS30 family